MHLFDVNVLLRGYMFILGAGRGTTETLNVCNLGQNSAATNTPPSPRPPVRPPNPPKAATNGNQIAGKLQKFEQLDRSAKNSKQGVACQNNEPAITGTHAKGPLRPPRMDAAIKPGVNPPEQKVLNSSPLDTNLPAEGKCPTKELSVTGGATSHKTALKPPKSSPTVMTTRPNPVIRNKLLHV